MGIAAAVDIDFAPMGHVVYVLTYSSILRMLTLIHPCVAHVHTLKSIIDLRRQCSVGHLLREDVIMKPGRGCVPSTKSSCMMTFGIRTVLITRVCIYGQRVMVMRQCALAFSYMTDLFLLVYRQVYGHDDGRAHEGGPKLRRKTRVRRAADLPAHLGEERANP